VELVLPKEVVELSCCDSFVLTDSSVVELSCCDSFVLMDSSVLEMVFSEWSRSNLWNLGLWRQAPWTSLQKLIAKLGVMRVSLMIAYHSFAHSLQVLVPKVGRQESEWVTLPQDIDLDLDEILDIFLDGPFWN
jgi:hypothetical protein